MSKQYYVYIMASKRNGTLYIGVTNDLERRVHEHKNESLEGFSKKYGTNVLVYFEETPDVYSALEYEKRLKNWNRKWKLDLIEKKNLHWEDLSESWIPDQVGDDKK